MAKRGTAIVDVVNREQKIEGREGSSILKIAQDANADWRHFCGGMAFCGTCALLVVDGEVSEPTEVERYFIEGWGYHPNFRLACQTRAWGEVKVVSLLDEGYDPERVVAAYNKAKGAAK
jgi:adenylate cyclase